MYLGLFRLTHRQVPGEQGTRAAPRRHAWAEARPSRQALRCEPRPRRHKWGARPTILRGVAVVVASSCTLGSLLYELPASAAPGATPALSTFAAGVGPGAGNGAQPQEVALGPDGNLWFTDDASGVFKFSPKTLRPVACSSSPSTVSCQVSANAVAPDDIVAGPDGAMWFTQSNGGKPKGASAGSVPGLDAITLGPDARLWFTEPAVDRIGEITPQAAGPAVHEFALPAADRLASGVGSPVTSTDAIAPGPGGDIWFTEQGSSAIGVMGTSGALVHKFALPIPGTSPAPLGITEGPNETMWFTENSTNQVASITTSGTITLHPLPAAADGPESIVYGPDGNLWFTDDTGVSSLDPTTGKVTVYRAHGSLLGPAGVTVGPDCASIWFTEPSADRLGRISPLPNTTGCKAGLVPLAGATTGAPESNPKYTIRVVRPNKFIAVKSAPFFAHGPPHFLINRALLPSAHPVCRACEADIAQDLKHGAPDPRPGPLPAYPEPFAPAAMWAQGPLCGTAGDACSYSDWSAASGHSVGYDGFPDSSTPSTATPLPSIITSPSPTVQFTIPCYFIWDPADNRPPDSSGDSYAIGDFLHCDAQIYGVTGPVKYQGQVPCSVCGVPAGSPITPEVGSGWSQLASGSVDVGAPGVSTIGTGATKIGTVACNQSSSAPPCTIYGKDIILTLFAPAVNTTIVFGLHYYEGDDRPGIESAQPGFISNGSGPIRLEGYRYPLSGSVTSETPAVQCGQNNANSSASTCFWQGVSSDETVLCLNSALASCGSPAKGALGFDMATGQDGFDPVDNPGGGYQQGFIDLPSLSIQPTAFVQSDVLISSIMYQPPGAQSTVDYSKKTTDAVQIAVGATSAAGTTNSTSDATTVTYKTGTPSAIGGAPLVGFNFSEADESGWDTDTSATETTATGSSATWATSVGDEWSTKPYTPPVPFKEDPTNYWFLGDQYILALYPQWAVWDFMSGPGEGGFIQSLVGTGGVASESVYTLLQCSGDLLHDTGQPAGDLTIPAVPNDIVLSPSECASLLTVDPFTTEFSQWLDVAPLQSDGRVVSLSDCCVTPGGNETTLQDPDPGTVDKIPLSNELQSVDTSSFTGSFTSKVTATVGTNWSVGATLPEGLGSGTFEQNQSTTTGGDWQIEYKNSLENSQDSINTATVTLSDNTNQINTLVYLDTTFGTFMFVAFGTKGPTPLPCLACTPTTVRVRVP